MSWLDRTRLRALISRWFEVPMVRILVTLHFTPNRVTVLGLLITFGAGILIAFEYPLAGGITVLAAGIFDLLDGALARETGRSTRFGAFLDSVTDRIGETCVLGGILVLALSRGDLPMAFLAYAACASCFLVSYARARAEGRRAMMVAAEQEEIAKIESSRAELVKAEAEVPKAMAAAFRSGKLGILDYYKLRNVQADTDMRSAISKMDS